VKIWGEGASQFFVQCSRADCSLLEKVEDEERKVGESSRRFMGGKGNLVERKEYGGSISLKARPDVSCTRCDGGEPREKPSKSLYLKKGGRDVPYRGISP